MKNNYFLGLLFCTVAILATSNCQAQFVQGYGFTIGLTRATQKWNYPDASEKMKFRNGFNGSIFGEFLSHDIYSWISELQYNQKGAKIRDSTEFKSRTNYFCWNNFLKMRSEGYDMNLYFLIGPRVEYLFSANGPVSFNTLHFSASAGIGSEFTFMDPWILFTELHYNPDITNSHSSADLNIKNRAWELKVGIKRKINPLRNFDKCPPVYL